MVHMFGHGPVSHSSVSIDEGHFLPPRVGAPSTRERERVPLTLPHVLLQPVQLPHAPALQSSGHWCVLHQRCSVAGGQILPPKLGGTAARVRDWRPPRHELPASWCESVRPNGAFLW